MRFSWELFGVLSAGIIWGVLALVCLAPRLRGLASVVSAVRKSPVRAVLAGLALGVLVSYAGTKPPATTYAVKFEPPQAFVPIESIACEPDKVYKLPTINGYRWRSSANDRLYDGGLLIFNLARPGAIVTMTAIPE